MTHGATWTIVVAGGSGTRFGSVKQFELVGVDRVIDRACDVARRSSDGVVVVLPSARGCRPGAASTPTRPSSVGRREASRCGPGSAPCRRSADVVCVHDAARPLASAELFASVVAAVRAGADGAVPAVAVTDTIKVVDHDGGVVATPDRSTLVAVQTPQAFRAAVLRAAHAAGGDDTDDAAAVERHGGRVVTVPGELWNRKITDRDDLDWVRSWLATEVGS